MTEQEKSIAWLIGFDDAIDGKPMNVNYNNISDYVAGYEAGLKELTYG